MFLHTGLLRMGDYYIDMGDMTKAMNMYGVAAVHGSPEVHTPH